MGARGATADTAGSVAAAVNHAKSSAKATTSPTIMTAGERTSGGCSATSASVDRTVRCRGVVPFSTNATGSLGARPAPMSSAAISARRCTPISTTTVPTPRRLDQSTCEVTLSLASWPVTTANEHASLRCVTGMPA